MALFTNDMEAAGVVEVSSRLIDQIRKQGRIAIHVLEPLPYISPDAAYMQDQTFDIVSLWFEWIGETAVHVMSRGRHASLLCEGLRPFVSGQMPSEEALDYATNFVRTLRD